MKQEESLAFATIEDLSALLARRKISPVELTNLFLGRIERLNPQLNAMLTVTAGHALDAARRAEKELARSRGASLRRRPLLGIPVTLKDHLDARHPHHGGLEGAARLRAGGRRYRGEQAGARGRYPAGKNQYS